MHRYRTNLLLLSATLALGAFAVVGGAGCTSSEPVYTGLAGSNGGGSAGATGSTAGATGGTAGATGSTAGATGSTAGATGSTAGATGSTAGASGGTAGATGSTAGASGSTAGASGTAGAGGAGGAGTAGASGAGGASLSFATDIYTPIIMPKCMMCHTVTPVKGNLDMTTEAKAYASLLGTATPVTGAAAQTDTSCKLLDTKKLRVEPGNPMNSYLYIKVSTVMATLTTNNCGPAMPDGNANGGITADQVTKIHDWIMQGANP